MTNADSQYPIQTLYLARRGSAGVEVIGEARPHLVPVSGVRTLSTAGVA